MMEATFPLLGTAFVVLVVLPAFALLAKAVTVNLFGAAALTEPAEVHVPDRYALERCLGRGGCGAVWLAQDRVLDRPVAVIS